MDGGAWKAAVHVVAEGRTGLSDFAFTFHFHALEKEMATHSSVLAWRTPGTGEPGGLLSVGSHRVGHDWSDLAAAAAFWLHLLNTGFLSLEFGVKAWYYYPKTVITKCILLPHTHTHCHFVKLKTILRRLVCCCFLSTAPRSVLCTLIQQTTVWFLNCYHKLDYITSLLRSLQYFLLHLE